MFNLSDLQTTGVDIQDKPQSGSKPSILESNIYKAIIKNIYGDESSSGSRYLACIFDIDGQEYKENIYITNRNKEIFYTVKNTGEKKALPGYRLANALSSVVTNKELQNQKLEEKYVKVYDFEKGTETPVPRLVLTDLVGKEIYLGIKKILENKRVLDTSSGSYKDSNEVREINRIDVVFNAKTKLATFEITKIKEQCMKNGSDFHSAVIEASKSDDLYFNKWLKNNKGITVNKTKTNVSLIANSDSSVTAATSPIEDLFSSTSETKSKIECPF